MSIQQPDLPPLVVYGQSSLMARQSIVSQEEIKTEEFQSGMVLLADCMDYYHGIGIAAPQIGWNRRVFCMGIRLGSERYPEAEIIPFEYWVNPEIVEVDDVTNWGWEGCLSVPGMSGWVERPASVKVAGSDEQGTPKERIYSGFAARVFQHEYDHLDGILYPMRVQHPRWLLPNESMAHREEWPPDWPSPGARNNRPGELSDLA